MTEMCTFSFQEQYEAENPYIDPHLSKPKCSIMEKVEDIGHLQSLHQCRFLISEGIVKFKMQKKALK